MTIEKSKGKARLTLPRSSDLTVPDTVGEPSGTRDAQGRFAAGNGVATGGKFKALIAQSFGT